MGFLVSFLAKIFYGIIHCFGKKLLVLRINIGSKKVDQPSVTVEKSGPHPGLRMITGFNIPFLK